MFAMKIFIALLLVVKIGQGYVLPPSVTVESSVLLGSWTDSDSHQDEAPDCSCIPSDKITFTVDSSSTAQLLLIPSDWGALGCHLSDKTPLIYPIQNSFYNDTELTSLDQTFVSQNMMVTSQGFGFMQFNWDNSTNFYDGTVTYSFDLFVAYDGCQTTRTFSQTNTIPNPSKSATTKSSLPSIYVVLGVILGLNIFICLFATLITRPCRKFYQEQNKIWKEEVGQTFIRKAQDNPNKFKINTKWFEFIQKTSKANFSKIFLALFSVFPPLMQIGDLWVATFYIEDCYMLEDSDYKDYLTFDTCLSNNGESIVIPSESACYADMLFWLRIIVMVSMLIYILPVKILKNTYVNTRYLVKLLVIRTKVDERKAIKGLLGQPILLIVGLYVVVLAIARYLANVSTCKVVISSITYIFNVRLPTSPVIAALQLLASYSAVIILAYNFFKDPVSGYTSIIDLMENLRSSQFDLSQVDYVMDYKYMGVIQRYLMAFKGEADEIVLLQAALLNLLDEGWAYECREGEENIALDSREAKNTEKRLDKEKASQLKKEEEIELNRFGTASGANHRTLMADRKET